MSSPAVPVRENWLVGIVRTELHGPVRRRIASAHFVELKRSQPYRKCPIKLQAAEHMIYEIASKGWSRFKDGREE